MDRYPFMLVREGGNVLWDGRMISTLIVRDADEEDQARADGWRGGSDHPLDHDGDGVKGGSLPRRGRPPKGIKQ